MIDIIVCGAAGRMGRKIIEVTNGIEGLNLIGAVEVAGHSSLGKKAKKNISMTSMLREVLKNKAVLVDFQKQYNEKQKLARPNLQIFEGKNELQQMMKDMLLYRDITVYAFWPIKNIINVLGKDFLREFHKKRVERNIKIKVIWPEKQIPEFKKYQFLKIKPELKREVRIAPAQIDFSLGYAIYGNTVRFISSSKENFGFLVESNELAKVMKNQFEVIWGISKKFK